MCVCGLEKRLEWWISDGGLFCSREGFVVWICVVERGENGFFVPSLRQRAFVLYTAYIVSDIMCLR